MNLFYLIIFCVGIIILSPALIYLWTYVQTTAKFRAIKSLTKKEEIEDEEESK